MIRNLLASAIILAASTSVLADIKDDIDNGATAAELATLAVSSCNGDSGCQELALAEMLTAGVDIEILAAAAVEAGISVTTVVKAAIAADVAPDVAITAATSAAVKSGQSVEAVMAEAKSIPGVPAEVAIAASSDGAVRAGVSQAAVDAVVMASITTTTQNAPPAAGPVVNTPAPSIPAPSIQLGAELSISPN
jgi:hypothetical protein